MAVPALVVAVVLILVFVPLWALIWGRKEMPATVRVDTDTGPARLQARDGSEP
jgi:protein-S-isoprenylcysteine O-methyltransferase Ste14